MRSGGRHTVSQQAIVSGNAQARRRSAPRTPPIPNMGSRSTHPSSLTSPFSSPFPSLSPPRRSARTLGATNAASRCRLRSAVLASCAASLAARARSRFCSSDRKYSPLSSCRSILEGGIGGGKGVYTFLAASLPPASSAGLASGFLRLTFFFLNLGRNLP